MRLRRPSTLVLVLGIGGAAIASACGGGNGVDTGGGAGDGGSSGTMSDATTSGSGSGGSGGSSGTSSSGGFGSSSGGDAQSSSGSASSGGDAQSGSSNGGDAQSAPDASTYACDGCAPFPGTDAGACSPSTLGPPTLAYPPDGVLLPPNMNVLEVQWVPPAGAALFEVDFENSVTDVRVETPCNAITSVRGVTGVGCGLTLSQAEWNNIASLNAGGEPLSVVVRATPASGTCTSASQQSVHINFAEQNLSGGIYYWQSAPTNAGDGGLQAGAAGGIYYHDFGTFDPAPKPFWTATATGRCVGCHTVSKDGTRMSLMNDDPNADDEYSDVQTLNMDIGSRTVLGGKNVSPGFQTFTHDNPGPAKYMVATTFKGGNDQAFAVWTSDGATLVKSNALPMNVQGTQPNLSADDKTLVFVAPKFQTISMMSGDDHFLGGALWSASFSEATSTISNYQAFLTPTATQNFYYPDQSPDGNWVVLNENDDTSAANNDGDAFYSRQARVKIMHFPPQTGDQPLDLTALNVANGLSNSWPRWSPVVQTYKGHQILWVTFSSNRDYGVHLKNTVNGYPQGSPLDGGNSSLSFDNYYPPESPMYDQPQPGMTGGVTFGDYAAPQIWMAAIVVDTDRSIDAQDRSFPAFWLPFQDVTAHNHSAQWVAAVQTTPPPVDAGAGDAGGGSDSGGPVDSGAEAGPTCHEYGQSCGAAGGTCCSDVVCCPGSSPSCQYTCAL